MVLPLMAAITVFAGCASPTSRVGGDLPRLVSSDQASSLSPSLSSTGKSQALTAEHVRRGMQLVRAGNLDAAAREFNAPLRYDPQNSYLRFLNGFSQHLMAERSDPARYEYARISYELALKFDPNNWLAAQQLARLSLSLRDYESARENFAHALLYRPDDAALLFGLAQASYYLGDMETAYAAIGRALALQPASPEIVAAQAMIAAAAGQPELAQSSLQRFRTMEQGEFRPAKLESRIKDWAVLQTQSLAPAGTGAAVPVAARTDATDQRNPAEPASAQNRMVMVDVVMIRTEENETSNKGVNLLENLSATFSGKFTPSQNRAPGANRWTWSDVVLATQPSVTALQYSLDIFNAGDDRTEVLALPTLIALDGKPSSSFAGLTLNVAVKGTNAATISALDAGITLEVLPTFLSDNTLQLHVLARRTFVEDGAVGSFQEAVRTSKNEVSADVVLDFGQTLVLGGLREKQTIGGKSGVPLLRDIPGLQYLFSHETTSDFHKSLLFLLTPRKVTAGLYRSPAAGDASSLSATPGERAQLDEFRQRYGYIFEMEPNIARIMHHLDRHQVAKGIHSADFFDKPWWGSTDSIDFILDRAASFLFY